MHVDCLALDIQCKQCQMRLAAHHPSMWKNLTRKQNLNFKCLDSCLLSHKHLDDYPLHVCFSMRNLPSVIMMKITTQTVHWIAIVQTRLNSVWIVYSNEVSGQSQTMNLKKCSDIPYWFVLSSQCLNRKDVSIFHQRIQELGNGCPEWVHPHSHLRRPSFSCNFDQLL